MAASAFFLSTAITFAPTPTSMLPSHSSRPLPPSREGGAVGEHEGHTALPMSPADVSDLYASHPLQAAVPTCGVKASVADGIAQARSITGARANGGGGDDDAGVVSWRNDLELRRNLAYILYGGIFVGALCHYEYDLLLPMLFGAEHSLLTSQKEVLFDNFVSGPLVWLPPAYLIKAIVYDYSLEEGMQKYVNDVMKEGLLHKYWAVWLPAQSVSFTVVPDHLRVAFMASLSFFWFILFSTVSSSSSSSVVDENEASA